MAGKLYGVGVGPGDPELMTIKAVRALKCCDVIGLPTAKGDQSTAYEIAAAAVPEIRTKERMTLRMPMTKDPEVLERSRKEAVSLLTAQLDAGKDVAFLTLGDPCIYATYTYLHRMISEQGYDTEIISGVPSFCAASAKLGISLAEGDEQLHIHPAAYGLSDAMQLPGTKVLMKAGKMLPEILKDMPEGQSAFVIEKCGMDGEQLMALEEAVKKEKVPGYFTLVIVK